jgi:hypothetical protein
MMLLPHHYPAVYELPIARTVLVGGGVETWDDNKVGVDILHRNVCPKQLATLSSFIIAVVATTLGRCYIIGGYLCIWRPTTTLVDTGIGLRVVAIDDTIQE